MRVEIHKLFQYLLDATDAAPEAAIGMSLSAPPRLGAFLADLDPDLPLDWNNRSFLGLPELRGHILREAKLTGVCAPDDVLVTAGAAEANFLAMTQLLQPGDEIVTETPGWPQAGVLARAKGVAMRTVRREEADGWALPLDALADAVSDRTKLIFLTNPNNPTGRMLREDDLRQIAAIADRVGAYLLVDEVYAGLEWRGSRAPSVAGLYPRGITTGSVSKALGLQGLRIGWMICRDPALIRDAVILRENASEIQNILGEIIAEIALRPVRYAAAIARAREDGLRNLALLDAFLASEPKLSWTRPEAGLIGLARFHDPAGGDELARRLLAAPYRTFLIPGSAYDQPDHVRLGVGGGADATLEKGLARLSALLADW